VSWPRRLLLSFPTAVLAVLALQGGPALAQAAPTNLSFGSDGPVWITVAGPGVPGGAQTVEGGSDTSLDFTAIPGDVLQVSGAGYDACTTVVGWEQSVPLPGGGEETTVVASGGPST
jgi:hypothetical protein